MLGFGLYIKITAILSNSYISFLTATRYATKS